MKLLVLPLLGNLALIKYLGYCLLGSALDRPPGKNTIREENKVLQEIVQPLHLALAIPYGDSSTYRNDSLVHLPAKEANKGETRI